mmetsp:Transcript_23907/g.75324  ORF Transcript_23907/g.75324 Transcript_23907/m.75324 type:complete len:267 (-) Transcript_23907:28-828(-)
MPQRSTPQPSRRWLTTSQPHWRSSCGSATRCSPPPPTSPPASGCCLTRRRAFRAAPTLAATAPAPTSPRACCCRGPHPCAPERGIGCHRSCATACSTSAASLAEAKARAIRGPSPRSCLALATGRFCPRPRFRRASCRRSRKSTSAAPPRPLAPRLSRRRCRRCSPPRLTRTRSGERASRYACTPSARITGVFYRPPGCAMRSRGSWNARFPALRTARPGTTRPRLPWLSRRRRRGHDSSCAGGADGPSAGAHSRAVTVVAERRMC